MLSALLAAMLCRAATTDAFDTSVATTCKDTHTRTRNKLF
jgi:hypothetical protein